MGSLAACAKCGATIGAGAHFCMKCGTDVSGARQSLPTGLVGTALRGAQDVRGQELIDAIREAALGEYEVYGELGSGGMATVFLAHDIQLDRKVALKVMQPALLAGEGMVERFILEARTAASLSHQHIIPIFAVKETADLLYFVMKFVDGRSLDSIIRQVGPLPVRMVETILVRVAEGLGYAHRSGVVHRDVKPANIMVDVEGLPVITDFGIAKVSDTQGLTMTGVTVGTPTYMSPEQCTAGEIGGASDQYSLGVVAYEMLSGKPPFDADTAVTLMFKHCHEPPEPLLDVRPDCPLELAESVMRMLEKQPEQRWPSMEQAVAGLRGTTLAYDHPVRMQMIDLAREGENREILRRISTPRSPMPVASKAPPREREEDGTEATTVELKSAQRSSITTSPGSRTKGAGRRRGMLAVAAVVILIAVGTWVGPRVITEPEQEGPARVQLAAPPDRDGVSVGDAAARDSALREERQAGDPPMAVPAEQPQLDTSATSGQLPTDATFSVTIDYAPTQITVGETHELRASARSQGGAVLSGRRVSWSTTDPSVARVSSEGRLEAVAPGTVTLMAAAEGRTAAATVSVRPVAVAAVSISPARLTGMEPGATAQLTARALDAGGGELAGRRVEWTTSDARVAVVSLGGLVQAMGPGSAQIRASVGGGVGEVSIEVVAPPAAAQAEPVTEADPRQEIGSAIEEYRLAIQAKDVARIRLVFPGITGEQVSRFEQSFEIMRDLRVEMRVGETSVRGDVANALVEATYRFHNTASRTDEETSATFRLVLRQTSDGWRITESH